MQQQVQIRAGVTAKKSELIRHNPTGGLKPELQKLLAEDHLLISEIAGMILENNFSNTLHEDILAAVGLSLDFTVVKKTKRDPAFREKVLRAYEYRCAVCGFDLRLGSSNLALEAAHIMWHQAGGPDIEPNGLALCSLPHKMLDRGAFTISTGYQFLVSQEVFGSRGMDEHLLRYHGEGIREPQSPDYMANPEYLQWHGQEVFRGPERTI